MKKTIAAIIIAVVLLSMWGCSSSKRYSKDTYDDYNYGYNYGYNNGYDYDNDDNYNYYGGRCRSCGKSIDSDRLYCDKCLGYGTCQDCGKSIDSDRLYCDRCLGYGTCQECGKSIASDRLYCNSCLYN